mmetsp:Transcript_23996/g.37613  ORF Transcript_23996/g.37613 Transcript_23996/m.37613 type:complete len:108 (-) Transcript_23996:35-358(-)
MPYCLSIRRAYSRARLSSRSTDSCAKENGKAELEGSEGSDAFNRKLTHRFLFSFRMVKQKLFEISIMPRQGRRFGALTKKMWKNRRYWLSRSRDSYVHFFSLMIILR